MPNFDCYYIVAASDVCTCSTSAWSSDLEIIEGFLPCYKLECVRTLYLLCDWALRQSSDRVRREDSDPATQPAPPPAHDI